MEETLARPTITLRNTFPLAPFRILDPQLCRQDLSAVCRGYPIAKKYPAIDFRELQNIAGPTQVMAAQAITSQVRPSTNYKPHPCDICLFPLRERIVATLLSLGILDTFDLNKKSNSRGRPDKDYLDLEIGSRFQTAYALSIFYPLTGTPRPVLA
ncbi:hypothetical protein BJ508DRAFT_315965 [Ascobolus immersus RN42]|uniref:Uncharacterized protein n=1 Tax=Ascobolus immersus RN42 TaxID=1160509 RepID=A0A3N4HCL6_ASCIM|nr:hypothetical protein BJ508DRAFT_315965 [Ascobolus immersus RN42]